jgi:HEAT repeat protein
VPVLINALHDSDLGVRSLAVSSLAEYGRDATDAIPALFQLVAEETTVSQRWLYPPDEHWRVKLDAERAITRIKEASDPEAAASRLTQVLHNSSWNGRMDAARSLGRLGPAAKSAIPTLREILEEEDRALQRVPNSIDHQNMYKAVSEALAEIEKETLPQR